MTNSRLMDTDVLIAGAGPVGLTTAIEVTRQGVDSQIVDRLVQPPRYPKGNWPVRMVKLTVRPTLDDLVMHLSAAFRR